MGQMQMDHDGELRARMRSRSGVTRSQYLPRNNYQKVARRLVGQDVVSNRPHKHRPASIAELIVMPEPAQASVSGTKSPATVFSSQQAGTAGAIMEPQLSRMSQTITAQSIDVQPRDRAAGKRLQWSTANLLIGMAIFVFLAGLASAWNGWMTNKHIAAQAAQVSQQVDKSGASDSPAASTNKPTATAVQNYAVAPLLPRYIDIPKLGTHARVAPMGVDSKNQLRAPGNVYDAGWYNASSQPGEAGAMLLDGHISSWQTKGVFYGIQKLQAGDVISITRGDNKVFNYTVKGVAVHDANSVDMSQLLLSADQAKPGLNLISCFGDVIPGTNEFDKRVVVSAVLE